MRDLFCERLSDITPNSSERCAPVFPFSIEQRKIDFEYTELVKKNPQGLNARNPSVYNYFTSRHQLTDEWLKLANELCWPVDDQTAGLTAVIFHVVTVAGWYYDEIFADYYREDVWAEPYYKGVFLEINGIRFTGCYKIRTRVFYHGERVVLTDLPKISLPHLPVPYIEDFFYGDWCDGGVRNAVNPDYAKIVDLLHNYGMRLFRLDPISHKDGNSEIAGLIRPIRMDLGDRYVELKERLKDLIQDAKKIKKEYEGEWCEKILEKYQILRNNRDFLKDIDPRYIPGDPEATKHVYAQWEIAIEIAAREIIPDYTPRSLSPKTLRQIAILPETNQARPPVN